MLLANTKKEKQHKSKARSLSPLPSYHSPPNSPPPPAAYTENFTAPYLSSNKVASNKGSISNARGFDTSKALKRKRKERFDNEYLQDLERRSSSLGRVEPGPGEGFGTCGLLSKPYARLTSAARAEDVRPLRVLEAALAYHAERWEAEEVGYEAFLDELKR